MRTRRRFLVPVNFLKGAFLVVLCLGWLAAANSTEAAIAGHLVINEVSGASAASTYDDWAELYNPTGADIDLAGWSLQKVTSGGTITRSDLSGTIPAGGYFLVARNHANTDAGLKSLADLAIDNFALADNNGLYLVNSNSSINPNDPAAVFVDLVGWGGIAYGEGSAFPANIAAGKSLSRSPDGEDTDDNSADFILLASPTPTASGLKAVPADEGAAGDIGGKVLVTVYPDAVPVQSIGANSASIVFRANTDGTAAVEYGLDSAYGSVSAVVAILANVDAVIALDGLECDTVYHYRISAANSDNSDSDSTADASFATRPCGLSVDSLLMTRPDARANNDYSQGWEWRFDITVWDEEDTGLKMKFNIWNGADQLSAGGNMRYSADGGATWTDILADDVYPDPGIDISLIDEDPAGAGRQVSILVQMKVPAGTLAGLYGTSYGILTE